MGIQSKSVQGLGAEPPVGSVRSKAPPSPRTSDFRGRSSPNTKNVGTFFSQFFFAPKFDEIFSKNFFFNFLKIFWSVFWCNRKKKTSISFWWYCGLFSKNFQHKIDHFAKNKKSQKLENCFFTGFRTLRILYSNVIIFEEGDGGEGVWMSLTRTGHPFSPNIYACYCSTTTRWKWHESQGETEGKSGTEHPGR